MYALKMNLTIILLTQSMLKSMICWQTWNKICILLDLCACQIFSSSLLPQNIKSGISWIFLKFKNLAKCTKLKFKGILLTHENF